MRTTTALSLRVIVLELGRNQSTCREHGHATRAIDREIASPNASYQTSLLDHPGLLVLILQLLWAERDCF